MTRKVAVVFGTRPEAIKLAPLIKELEKSEGIEVIKISTGQHKEMLNQVLELFDIIPDYDLRIMSINQGLNSITSKILESLDALFERINPNIIIVHGDTTTAMSAALCGFQLKVPVVHVEAGLRSKNIQSPWPEELNRTFISLVSSFNFAPTEEAKLNLLNQNINPLNVEVTGNTVIDALRITSEKIKNKSLLNRQLSDLLNFNIKKNKILLVTGHRRESLGAGFQRICTALKKIANEPNVKIVYPVHLNPLVKKPVEKYLGDDPNIILLPPLDYEPFVKLMMLSNIILTDSGGIQEEAPYLGKPVLLMRENSERPEAIESGCVKIVGTDVDNIVNSTIELLNNKKIYKKMAQSTNPYGDGFASFKIVSRIKNLLIDLEF